MNGKYIKILKATVNNQNTKPKKWFCHPAKFERRFKPNKYSLGKENHSSVKEGD